MSWIDKHEPGRGDMRPKRCDGDEPWHHAPHEWYEQTRKDVEVVASGATVTRCKIESVTWNWCEGVMS